MIDTKQGGREVYYNYFSPPPPLTFIVSSSKIIYISYYLLSIIYFEMPFSCIVSLHCLHVVSKKHVTEDS